MCQHPFISVTIRIRGRQNVHSECEAGRAQLRRAGRAGEGARLAAGMLIHPGRASPARTQLLAKLAFRRPVPVLVLGVYVEDLVYRSVSKRRQAIPLFGELIWLHLTWILCPETQRLFVYLLCEEEVRMLFQPHGEVRRK